MKLNEDSLGTLQISIWCWSSVTSLFIWHLYCTVFLCQGCFLANYRPSHSDAVLHLAMLFSNFVPRLPWTTLVHTEVKFEQEHLGKTEKVNNQILPSAQKQARSGWCQLGECENKKYTAAHAPCLMGKIGQWRLIYEKRKMLKKQGKRFATESLPTHNRKWIKFKSNSLKTPMTWHRTFPKDN